MTCKMPSALVWDDRVSVEVSTPGRTWPVTFAGSSNCMRAVVKGLQRAWKTGYTDIRNYDEFTIVVDNPRKRCVRVPFLLDLSQPANITGLCPILCDEDGTPTGIPVQLSKNWHYRELGAYLRAYTLLPASPASRGTSCGSPTGSTARCRQPVMRNCLWSAGVATDDGISWQSAAGAKPCAWIWT